jgi:hypothetical protein
MLGFYDGADVLQGTITVDTTANTTAYNTTSDGNLKNVIGELELTDEIDRLRPVLFSWKSKPDGLVLPGFIAQEVFKIVPKACTPPGKATAPHWQMDEAKLMPLVVAELKALRKRVVELENRG